ncbi:MAG: metal-dependent transcriptional regulator [Actinobacteria bacterium]|nr:metal-dependent transcriptional regulator [Actinomycetota bacterium]
MAKGAIERYLETIYELELSSEVVRVKDIARALDITYPSVSEMLGKLARDNLIEHGKYRHVSLTEKGAKIARRLDKKHGTIKRFFTEILGVNEETADMDACEIEHVISDETLRKLVAYLESNPHMSGISK